MFHIDAHLRVRSNTSQRARRSDITPASHTARSRAYRGGEKGPQGSGTKTVSICVAWTHRGLERYPDVFSCFRRSEKHPQTSVLDPKWIFWSRNSRLPNLDISRDHRRYIIYIISKIPADTTHIFLSSMNLLTQEMLTLLGIILRR